MRRSAAEAKRDTHDQQACVQAWLEMPAGLLHTNWRDHPVQPGMPHAGEELAATAAGQPQQRARPAHPSVHPVAGKTCAMFEILRRLHFAGVPCMAVEVVAFAEHAVMAAICPHPPGLLDAQDWLRRAKTVRVLFSTTWKGGRDQHARASPALSHPAGASEVLPPAPCSLPLSVYDELGRPARHELRRWHRAPPPRDVRRSRHR